MSDIIEVVTDPVSVVQVYADPVTIVEVVTAGPPGLPGAPARIVTWFEGEGPPPLAVPGAVAGDMYHDTVDHRFYQLR